MERRKHQPSSASTQIHLHVALPLWVEAKEKIASFHEVEGWQKLEFASEEYCEEYINNLVVSHYRFQ